MAFFETLLLLVIVIVFGKRMRVNVLNPAFLYAIVMLSTLAIGTLHLSGLQSEYPQWFVLVVYISVLLFAVGGRLSDKISLIDSKKKVLRHSEYVPESMRFCAISLWAIVVFSFLVMVKLLGPPPAISYVSRADYFVSGWGTLYLMQSSVFCLVLYDYYKNHVLGKFSYVIIGSIVLMAILMSNKYQLVYLLILYLVNKNCFQKKIKIKSLLLVAVFGVLMFSILYKYVYSYMYGVTLEQLYFSYQMNVPESLLFITQPYLYVAFNVENLYRFLSNVDGYTFGYVTFKEVFETLSIDQIFPNGIIENANLWKEMLQVPSLTTGTILSDFAQDGGIIGIFVFSFLAGAWSVYCYKVYTNKKNFGCFFLYASSLCSTFLSFFTNTYTMKSTIINIVAALIMSRIIQTKFVWRSH